MMYTIKELQQIISEAIEKEQFVKDPPNLYEPIEYTLANGGKRLRPVLVLMAYNLFRKDVEKAIKPALGIEIFHNFTLLHDDIMDKADIRRKMPTVHKKWNENVAILSGDAMFIKSYDYIYENDSPKFKDIIKLFNRTALEVCEGQQYDMDFENRESVELDEYLKMIRLKTAVLIAASLKMGALLADASMEQADILYQFGINIGLGFQLQDDYLDVYGNMDVFGKKIGGDIVSNKKTFMLIKALEIAKDNQGKELKEWISKTTFDEDDKIEAVRNVYNQIGINALVKNKINDYHARSLENLNQLGVAQENLVHLLEFAGKLVTRVS